ncbi:MAG: hypothetical protein JWN14_1512 [Chthonomonadales bacterium]|nr:hypothetical protein [Chthonomonadales bacterium]
MKTLFPVLAFLSICLMTPAQAQNKAPIASAPLPGVKWEYLVVSFGKTLYSDPVSSPELKEAGLSKLLFYSQAGIITAQEAITTQRSLDTLGKFGWELTSVVGSIGGDQQMMFKRPFESDRARKEAEMIKAEGEMIAQARRKREQEKTPSVDELVDLDAKERQQKIDKEAEILRTDLQTYKDIPIKDIQINASETYDEKFRATIEVTVDGTASLIKGNTYRASAATDLAKKVAVALHEASNLKVGQFETAERSFSGDVRISVTVIVAHGGKVIPVAYKNVSGKREWTLGK